MSEPFRYYLRVRYGECDAQHVVYNAIYGEYLDLACTEYLRTALAPDDAFNGNFEFQVVRMLVEWKAPARFDNTLEIAVRPTRFGSTSFTLGFEIRIADTPDVIVTGETVNVHATRQGSAWAKAPIPAATRAKLDHHAAGKIVDHAGHLAKG